MSQLSSQQSPTQPESDLKKETEAAIGQYVEEPWDMIGSYFGHSHLDKLVRHQLESYNDLVYSQL